MVLGMSKSNKSVFVGEATMQALEKYEEMGRRLKIGDSIAVSLKNCVIIITREDDDPIAGEAVGIYTYRPIRIKGKIVKSEMERINAR